MLDDNLDQRFDARMSAATGYLVLSNAGGAVATLSFLGTGIARGVMFKLAVLPLAFFIAGIVITGLVIIGQLTGAWDEWVRVEKLDVFPEATSVGVEIERFQRRT